MKIIFIKLFKNFLLNLIWITVLGPKTIQPIVNSITQMLEASVYFEDGRYLRNEIYKKSPQIVLFLAFLMYI
jgi:hypothetical protein